MSNKNLDELLSGLKKEYEKMPEQVDKRTIMQRIFRAKEKPRFGKAMPFVAIVAGLCLFMLISLPYVSNYDQADHNPNYLEMYYANALEEFKESLGLEDVEEFNQVLQAESVVESYGSSSDPGDYETAKAQIDDYLTTPKEMVEEARSDGQFFADDEQFNRKMTQMLYSLQSYFSDLLVEYSIQRKDQDAILDALDHPESYQGPQEIKDVLGVLDEQGYKVIRQEGPDQLRVGLDFSWQLEQSEGLPGSEGYMRYLELMEYMAGNFYDIERNEIDSILLEVEDIYDTYPDEREAIFENSHLLIEVNHYLREYLALSLDNDDIDWDGLLEEYHSFLDENQDSRFWEIVKARVDTIEEESTDYLNFQLGTQLDLLFNDQFEGITFNDIINLNHDDRYRAEDIQESYVEYRDTKDEKVLENLDPAEMVLLYKYAFERSDSELYSTLFAEGNKWKNYDEEALHETLMKEGWRDTFLSHAGYLVLQEFGEDRFTVSFVFHNIESAQMEWVKEGGVWKLLDQWVEEVPDYE